MRGKGEGETRNADFLPPSLAAMVTQAMRVTIGLDPLPGAIAWIAIHWESSGLDYLNINCTHFTLLSVLGR